MAHRLFPKETLPSCMYLKDSYHFSTLYFLQLNLAHIRYFYFQFNKFPSLQQENGTTSPNLNFNFLASQGPGINETYFIFGSGIIFFLNASLICSLFLLLNKVKNHESLNSLNIKSTFVSVISFVLMIQSTFLYIPSIYIITSSTMISYSTSYQMSFVGIIFVQLTNSVSLICSLFILLYTKRNMNLKVASSDFASWSISTDSNMVSLEIITKLLIPMILVFDKDGKYISIELMVSFSVNFLYLIGLEMITYTFERSHHIIKLISQATLVLALQIYTVDYLLAYYQGKKEAIYLCTILLFQWYGAYRYNEYRKNGILEKLRQGVSSVKIEIEVEISLLSMIRASETLIKQQDIVETVSSEDFIMMMGLWEGHKSQCIFKVNDPCPCINLVQYFNLLRLGARQNLETIQIKYLKLINKYSIIADQHQVPRYSSSFQNCIDNTNVEQVQALTNESIIKINISDVKREFFSGIMMLYVNYYKTQFPKSLKLHLIQCYILTSFIRKTYNCLNVLRSFDQNYEKLAISEKLAKNINEYYFLSRLECIEGLNTIYHYKLEKQSDTINIDYFIDVDKLMTTFNDSIDGLKGTAVEFWSYFINTEGLESTAALHKGQNVAYSMRQMIQSFNILEEQVVKKDPAIYMKFALVQRFIMNNERASNDLLSKMRSLQQMMKIKYNFTQKNSGFNEESAFFIVDGSIQKMGHILKINKIGLSLLKRNATEVKVLQITGIQPRLIAEEHHRFLKNFCMNGHSTIVNKMTVQFIKDKNGCIILTEILLKIHYSQMYGYCFFTLVKILNQVVPFQNGVSYRPSNLVFLTVNPSDGRVYEFSESFMQLLKLACIHNSSTMTCNEVNDSLVDDKKIKIDEILTDFNLTTILNQPSYEGMHNLDLTCLSSLTKRHCVKLIKVRVSFKTEKFTTGYGSIGYITMIPEQDFDNPYDQTLFQDQSSEQKSEFGELYESHASSVNSQDSQYESQVQLSSLLNNNDAQQIPRTLKMVLRLLTFLLIVSLLIATVNLVINIQNKSEGSQIFLAVQKSIMRVKYTIKNRLITRNLINIANGNEPNSSSIISDRWSFYKNLLVKSTLSLSQVEVYLDNNLGFSLEGDTSQTPNIQLSFIDVNGNVNFKNSTLMNAQSLFISRLTELATFNRSMLRGNLNIQTLTPHKAPISASEQLINFIVINGNGVIREYNSKYANFILAGIQQVTTQHVSLNLITTLVSIGSILIVLVIIAPIVSKTEERKYLALNFFLKIPIEHRKELLAQCNQSVESIENLSPNMKNEDDVIFQQSSVDDLSLDSDHHSRQSQKKKSIAITRKLSKEIVQCAIEEQPIDNDVIAGSDIKQQGRKEKLKTLFVLFFAMVIFSGYFTGSFFLVRRFSQQMVSSANDLQLIFVRDTCFENLITLIRENQIRNQSILLTEDNSTVASLNKMQQCAQIEVEYQKLQKARGSSDYLQEARYIMDFMETDQFCVQIFDEDAEEVLQAKCKTAMHGLLNMGVTNALSFIYRYAQQLQMKFDGGLQTHQRNLSFLQSALSDSQTIEMIDLKLYLFDQVFLDLSGTCITSVVNYFNNAMNEMIAIYVIFVTFLLGCMLVFIFVVFKRLKDTMWNTNILLRIIPSATALDKATAQNLKTFFVA